jgi:glc operon protein GlcG
MSTTRAALRLTLEGAQVLIGAAVSAAKQMQVPQCIAVVDDACSLLAFVRMDGARILSIVSAQRKAKTAATTGKPTGELSADVEIKLAVATDGEMVNLKGGLPVIIDEQVIGGIGVGSGSGEQDREIANAALQALPGAKTFAQ